jgi:hypothetical protein
MPSPTVRASQGVDVRSTNGRSAVRLPLSGSETCSPVEAARPERRVSLRGRGGWEAVDAIRNLLTQPHRDYQGPDNRPKGRKGASSSGGLLDGSEAVLTSPYPGGVI